MSIAWRTRSFVSYIELDDEPCGVAALEDTAFVDEPVKGEPLDTGDSLPNFRLAELRPAELRGERW